MPLNLVEDYMRSGIVIATVAAAASLLSGGSALAAGVTLDNIFATWFNPVPTAPDVTITNDGSGGTSSARWGDPFTSGGSSGYDFTPVASSTGEFAFGSTFTLGDFSHLNFPVFPPSLTSIDLQITYDAILNDGTNTASVTGLSSTFSFTHFETPNDGTPCAAGGVQPCPDLVTVLNNVGTNTTIELGGVEFQLFVTGFDLPSGNTFLTEEGQTNTAPLLATISDKPPVSTVPVPAALPMLLSALGMFGVISRRRKAV